jgi:MYXO-CTERM domain-containing protein
VDIIASGPHNAGGLDMEILNGLAPEPSRAIVASFRGLEDRRPNVWPTVAIAALVLGALWMGRRR